MPRGIPKSKEAEDAYLKTPVPVGAKTYPSTGEPLPEGIEVRSARGVQLRFTWRGERCFETVAGPPTVGLVQKAVKKREQVLLLISLGKFDYGSEFPDSRRLRRAVEGTPPEQMQNVGQALDAWFACTKGGVGPNTEIDYRRAIANVLKPMPASRLGLVDGHPLAAQALSDLPITELTDVRLAALRDHLCAERGHKRVNNLLIPLRGVTTAAVLDGHLRADPFAKLKPLQDPTVQADEPVATNAADGRSLRLEDVANFKSEEGKADPFTPAETLAILRQALGPLLNMLVFWFMTGLRTGELLAMQWQDVDLARGLIVVRRSVSRGILKTVKTNRHRVVRLLPPARAALEAQVAYSGAQRAWIFPNPATGTRFANESKLTKRWKRLLAAAGVRYRRPYQVRHTVGSNELSSGVPIIEVAKRLGHKDFTMLVKHYGRWIREVSELEGVTLEGRFGQYWAEYAELLRTQQQDPEVAMKFAQAEEGESEDAEGGGSQVAAADDDA